MADNVTLPGAGVIAAADDIGGVKVQRVKLIYGADGVNDGDVAKTNPYPVTTDFRVISGVGMASSFRILGNAAALHNVFSIENSVGSAVLVSVKKISIELDATAVLTANMPLVKLSRPTALPTGGTALSKGVTDSTKSTSASVIVRGANASDGGAATAITATAGTMLRADYIMRLHTAVGQVLSPPHDLITDGSPIILRANEALLIVVDGLVTTGNPATNHWQVDIVWEEYT
jgi:hypothetical protein